MSDHHGQGFSNIYSACLLLLHLAKDLKPWKAVNIFTFGTTEVQDMVHHVFDINRMNIHVESPLGTNKGFLREDLQIGTGWDQMICCPATYRVETAGTPFPHT